MKSHEISKPIVFVHQELNIWATLSKLTQLFNNWILGVWSRINKLSTDNNIGSSGAQYISEALKFNKSIHSLSLYGIPRILQLTTDNNIDSIGAQHLSEALKTNTSLQYLYHYGMKCCEFYKPSSANNTGSPGARYLSEALKINTSLRLLYLNSTKY